MIKQSSLFILASLFCFNGNIKIHGMDGNNDPYKRICQLDATVKELKHGNQLLENDNIKLTRQLEISKKDLQNQAIDTENKANDLAKTFEEMKKGYTALLTEKEQLVIKNTRLEHDKKILAKEVKRLQPYSLKTKVLITTGIATTAWTLKEAYDAYQKLSTHEKWKDASCQKRTALIIKHTAKNMASRPRQIVNFVKEKLQ